MTNFKLKIAPLNSIISLLGLAYLVQFVAFIMNHVYRLRHAGKVCSGDYLSDAERQDETILAGYVKEKGAFLWGWLLANWIILGLACLCGCVAVAVIAKRS